MSESVDRQDHTRAWQHDEDLGEPPGEQQVPAIAIPDLEVLKRLAMIKAIYPVRLGDASDARLYVRSRNRLLGSLERSEQLDQRDLRDRATTLLPDRLDSIIDGDVDWDVDKARAANLLSRELAVRYEAAGLGAALDEADERSTNLYAELARIEAESKQSYEFQAMVRRHLGRRPKPSLAPEVWVSGAPPPNADIPSVEPTSKELSSAFGADHLATTPLAAADDPLSDLLPVIKQRAQEEPTGSPSRLVIAGRRELAVSSAAPKRDRSGRPPGDVNCALYVRIHRRMRRADGGYSANGKRERPAKVSEIVQQYWLESNSTVSQQIIRERFQYEHEQGIPERKWKLRYGPDVNLLVDNDGDDDGMLVPVSERD